MKIACVFLFVLASLTYPIAAAQTTQPDWAKIEEETMRHFQALVRIDTSGAPNYEAPAVEYLKSVLEKEGIETKIFSVDPKRPNLEPIREIKLRL